MAALTGQTIAASYEQLLHVDRDGGGNTSTLVNVKDGDNGTTFCISMTDASTGKAVLAVDGSHASGTEVQIDNSATDGDAFLSFQLSGTSKFTMGVDDGDSDIFKIGTTAIGTGTMFALDTNSRISLSNNDDGTSNTIFGKTAGDPDGAGDQNVFIGELAGGAGTQTDAADNNIAIGFTAGTAITTGDANTIVGSLAGDALTDGLNNVIIGCVAGSTTTSVTDAVMIGKGACESGDVTAAAAGTVAIGRAALAALTSGEGNVAVGYQSLDACTDSDNNTAVGHQALTAMTGSAGITANVAVGFQAGTAITKGRYNTALGYHALPTDDVGDASTAVGYHALYSQNSDSDNEVTANVALGHSAGFYNVTGQNNTSLGYHSGMGTSEKSHSGCVFIGSKAGEKAYTGDNNIAIGYQAMDDTDADATVGGSTENIFIGASAGGGTWVTAASNYNVAIGNNSMDAAMNGALNNTAVGHLAASAIVNADNGTYIGFQAGLANVSGGNSTIIGYNAGSTATDLDQAVLVGAGAGQLMTSGDRTVAVGYNALNANLTGLQNTAVGYFALTTNEDGNHNTAVGYEAMNACTEDDNTGIGYNVLSNLTGGQNNVHVGTSTTVSSANNNFTIFLGSGAGATPENDFQFGKASNYVSNDFDTDANWSHSCDERKKRNINDDSLGLDFIKDLRTVTFQWKPAEEHPEEWHAWDEDEDGNKVYHEMTTDAVMHGMIAQEVKSALDTASVSTFSGWSVMENGQQQLSPEMFVYPLIKAVQELSAKVEELEAKLK